MTVRIARISTAPLSLDAHVDAVQGSAAGAVTTFTGSVRDHDPDAADTVAALEYTAHPDAEATLHRLAEESAEGTDAVVAVSHRIGRLEVGDAAVVIAVASAHREEAMSDAFAERSGCGFSFGSGCGGSSDINLFGAKKANRRDVLKTVQLWEK